MMSQSLQPAAIFLVSFRLRKDANVSHFLQLSSELQSWLCTQDGFKDYALYRDNDRWSDTMIWRDRAAAEAGNAAFAKTALASSLTKLVEPDYHAFLGTQVPLQNGTTP